MKKIIHTAALILVFSCLGVAVGLLLLHCGGEEAELTEAPVFLSADGEIMRECLREAMAIVKLEKTWYLREESEVTAAAIIAVPLFEQRIGDNSQ